MSATAGVYILMQEAYTEVLELSGDLNCVFTSEISYYFSQSLSRLALRGEARTKMS